MIFFTDQPFISVNVFFAQCSGDIFFQKVMLRFKMPQDIYPCSAEKLRRAKSRSWSRWNKSTISIRRLFELFGLMRYACTIWETITTESERGDKSSCKTCCLAALLSVWLGRSVVGWGCYSTYRCCCRIRCGYYILGQAKNFGATCLTHYSHQNGQEQLW